jgi:hypothetical protein
LRAARTAARRRATRQDALLHLQSAAGNRATCALLARCRAKAAGSGARRRTPALGPVLQRMVINMQTGDADLERNARKIADAKNDRLAEELSELAGLKADETLHLVAHTDAEVTEEERWGPAGHFAKHDPHALAELLVKNGLPADYRGRIYLDGCVTGTADKEGRSYASRFQRELRDVYERPVVVKANLGLSDTDDEGHARVTANTPEAVAQDREHSRLRAETARDTQLFSSEKKRLAQELKEFIAEKDEYVRNHPEEGGQLSDELSDRYYELNDALVKNRSDFAALDSRHSSVNELWAASSSRDKSRKVTLPAW